MSDSLRSSSSSSSSSSSIISNINNDLNDDLSVIISVPSIGLTTTTVATTLPTTILQNSSEQFFQSFASGSNSKFSPSQVIDIPTVRKSFIDDNTLNDYDPIL